MRWAKGKTICKELARTTSVTFTKGNLVQLTSGLVATATAQSVIHVGIILQSVASSDSDFATAGSKVLVEIPLDPSCELESAVTGTLLTTDIGVRFDLSDASTVNQDGTTYKVVTCKKFISTAKGRFTLKSNLDTRDSAS